MSVTLDEPVYPGRGRPTTSSVINTLNHAQRNDINSYMMEIWNLESGLDYRAFSGSNHEKYTP